MEGGLSPGLGPNSWLRLKLCNKVGICCTTEQVTSTNGAGQQTSVAVNPTEPCHSMIMDKYRPNSDGQSVVVEHGGAEMPVITSVSLRFEWKTFLACWDRSNDHVLLVGNPGGSDSLDRRQASSRVSMFIAGRDN